MSELKYVLYARKSSENKERQALSIEDQLDEDRKYASLNRLQVIKELSESKSAFKPRHREKFDLMIEMLRSRQADAILTWKPNRLCRNPEEGGLVLQMLQDGLIKEIRTATGEIYTQDSDHLILQIHFGMANQYSRNLSKDVRRGLEHKIGRGQYPRPAPLGYEGFGIVGSRQIRPNPIEAPFVKELFEYASTGYYSLKRLANLAKNKGFQTRKGKAISPSHMYNLLSSPVYYGDILNNGVISPGEFEPLLSKTLWMAVQEQLRNRSKQKKFNWEHVYNGLAKCAECGSSITTTIKKKYYKKTNRHAIYTYHHCGKRLGYCAKHEYLSTEEFEKAMHEGVKDIFLDEEVWTLGIKLLKEKHRTEVTHHKKQTINYQLRFNMLQDKINRLIDMRADRELTKEEFLAQKILLSE